MSDGALEPTDAQLLIRWRDDRCETAFRLLVERHGPLVRRVARSHCRDVHLSEDAVQQTFLALAHHAARITPGPLAPWLHTTAWRAARDLRRKARNQPIPSGDFEQAMNEPDPSEPDREDLVRAVDEALAALPDHLRAVALMHGLQGLPQRQCAEQLGHPSGSISSMWAQARQRLQRHLQRFGGLELAGVAGIWQEANAAHAPSRQLIEDTVALATTPPRVAAVSTLSAWRWTVLLLLVPIGLGLWWLRPDVIADGAIAEQPSMARPTDRSQWQVDPAISFSIVEKADAAPVITLRKGAVSPHQAQARWLPERPDSFTLSYRYWSCQLDTAVPPPGQWLRRTIRFVRQDGGYQVTDTDAGKSRSGWVTLARYAADDPFAWAIGGTGEIHLTDLSLQP